MKLKSFNYLLGLLIVLLFFTPLKSEDEIDTTHLSRFLTKEPPSTKTTKPVYWFFNLLLEKEPLSFYYFYNTSLEQQLL